jgi:hypothetical protein
MGGNPCDSCHGRQLQENAMAEPPAPTAPAAERRSPLTAHPARSLLITLLLLVSILGTLIVPIYASVTPRIGDFPFFYFYLLIFMPFVALVLWIVSRLQKGLTK